MPPQLIQPQLLRQGQRKAHFTGEASKKLDLYNYRSYVCKKLDALHKSHKYDQDLE